MGVLLDRGKGIDWVFDTGSLITLRSAVGDFKRDSSSDGQPVDDCDRLCFFGVVTLWLLLRSIEESGRAVVAALTNANTVEKTKQIWRMRRTRRRRQQSSNNPAARQSNFSDVSVFGRRAWSVRVG